MDRATYMTPRLAAQNVSHNAKMDIPLSGEFALRDAAASVQFSDSHNLRVGEFSVSTFLARLISAVLEFIEHVRVVRIPTQIVQSVIHGIVIAVAGFKSGGTWAYKCSQDKMGNGIRFLLAVVGKANIGTRFLAPFAERRVDDVRFGNKLASVIAITPHTAKIADFVSGVIGDWLPNFGGGTIGVSHASSPFQNWFGESRLGAETSFGSFILP